MLRKIKDEIVLIGAPNVGKSTIFNRLTTSVAQVANFSGTTNVENKGYLKGEKIEVVDLPGANSLTSLIPTEKLTNNYFLNNQFQKGIGVISALSIKRNLLNMIDYLETHKISNLFVTQIDEQRTFHIAKKRLANLLGIDVIPIVSTKMKLNKELKQLLINKNTTTKFYLNYQDKVELAIISLVEAMTFSFYLPKRFFAIQLLLGRENMFKKLIPDFELNKLIKLRNLLSLNNKLDYVDLITKRREAYVEKLIKQSCLATSAEVIKQYKKPLVDKILLNKFWGILIFIILMGGVYFLSFSGWTGSYLQSKISQLFIGDEDFIGLIGILKQELIHNKEQWFGISLILDGILNPIFLTLSFFPYLFIFFFLTTLMKQSGYYSRAVAVFDSILERFGLSGHSIISIIAGLGCNLPALMATRNIPSKKERHVTAFIVPLIPCSARLSIGTILISLFFSSTYSWAIMIAIVVCSGILWLIISLVVSRTMFRKEYQWIVLTIPKWRKVDLLSLTKSSFLMIKSFIIRMGSYIVVAGLIVYFLSALGTRGVNQYEVEGYSNSFIYPIASNLGYIFKPLGFGDAWQTTSALIGGIPAKEVVLTSLVVTSGGLDNIVNILSPAAALSFVIFSLFYTPCSPATAILHKETKSTKYLTVIHLVFSFIMAWIIATIIFQLMSL